MDNMAVVAAAVGTAHCFRAEEEIVNEEVEVVNNTLPAEASSVDGNTEVMNMECKGLTAWEPSWHYAAMRESEIPAAHW